jgi:hypothetical protein
MTNAIEYDITGSKKPTLKLESFLSGLQAPNENSVKDASTPSIKQIAGNSVSETAVVSAAVQTHLLESSSVYENLVFEMTDLITIRSPNPGKLDRALQSQNLQNTLKAQSGEIYRLRSDIKNLEKDCLKFRDIGLEVDLALKGEICFCNYKTPEAIVETRKHEPVPVEEQETNFRPTIDRFPKNIC